MFVLGHCLFLRFYSYPAYLGFLDLYPTFMQLHYSKQKDVQGCTFVFAFCNFNSMSVRRDVDINIINKTYQIQGLDSIIIAFPYLTNLLDIF